MWSCVPDTELQFEPQSYLHATIHTPRIGNAKKHHSILWEVLVPLLTNCGVAADLNEYI